MKVYETEGRRRLTEELLAFLSSASLLADGKVNPEQQVHTERPPKIFIKTGDDTYLGTIHDQDATRPGRAKEGDIPIAYLYLDSFKPSDAESGKKEIFEIFEAHEVLAKPRDGSDRRRGGAAEVA